jgi:Uma2 family endonuclease
MASSSTGGAMEKPRITTDQYLSGPETMMRRELIFGVLNDPPSALRNHQAVVTHVSVLLAQHVWSAEIGQVYVSPLDVVLDHDNALVVQPDVMYVSNERRDILGRWVHGAPDIAVEVESRGNRHYDRVSKLKWYRQYGVREYWLVDPDAWTVTVLGLEGERITRDVFTRTEVVRSGVLPGFQAAVRSFFDPA